MNKLSSEQKKFLEKLRKKQRKNQQNFSLQTNKNFSPANAHRLQMYSGKRGK